MRRRALRAALVAGRLSCAAAGLYGLRVAWLRADDPVPPTGHAAGDAAVAVVSGLDLALLFVLSTLLLGLALWPARAD